MKSNDLKWNLSLLYKNDTDPQIELDRKSVLETTKVFIKKWRKNTLYLKDPQVLLDALIDYEVWKSHFGAYSKEVYYFWLRLCQDQTNPKIKAKFNQIEELAQNLENDIQFFTMQLSKINPTTQRLFLNSPILLPYKHFLERLFAESKYLLTEQEEKIINLKSLSGRRSWIKITQEFLSKEEVYILNSNNRKEKVNFEMLLSYMNSPKQKVRDQAAVSFNNILQKHVDLAEHEINALLLDKKIDDQLRNVSRPDEIRHLSDDIESSIVDTLIESVSKYNFLAQKFYKLKAELLGKEFLQYHERNVPIGRLANHKYSYNQSIELVKNVFLKLDPKFHFIVEQFQQNGQIDVLPNKGKRGGAFCAHELKTLPSYILLNYNNKLQDVLTLAHELGHGINNELMREKQNALHFATPLSTAEVASTFMEDFVLDELLKDATDNQKLDILMMKLNDDISTIFRQIACYKFELSLHRFFREQGYLAKETIGEIFQQHMKSYMGNAVKQNPGSENWWVYWSHIRSYFYVYSYASGLLISKSLQHSVKQDPYFIEKVKELLSTGISESPKTIFKQLGINIDQQSFWDNGLQEIAEKLNEVEKLAIKLKKIKKS